MMKEKYGVIYMIRNKINNKIYFGQTSEKNGIDRRYKNDIIKHTHNTHLKSSLIKHGIDNFEVVKEFDVAYSKEELDKLEVMYIKIYKTTDSNYGYNKKNGGANGKLSDETKLKLSIATKQLWKNKEYRKNMTAIMKEKWKDEEYRNTVMTKAFTPENREKLSKLCTKRFKGVPKTDEEKLKNSIATKRSWTNERKSCQSERSKNQWENETYRENISKKITEKWQDKEYKNTTVDKMKRVYILRNVETDECLEFLGRYSIAEYIGKSTSYVTKYMSKKLLHNGKYAIERKGFELNSDNGMRRNWQNEEYRNKIRESRLRTYIIFDIKKSVSNEVKGINAISEFLNISYSYAQKLINSDKEYNGYKVFNESMFNEIKVV